MSISMRLRLNLCDVDMQLKINDWSKPDFEEEWNDNWCDVELKFQSKYLNYDPSGELLMSSDVLYGISQTYRGIFRRICQDINRKRRLICRGAITEQTLCYAVKK